MLRLCCTLVTKVPTPEILTAGFMIVRRVKERRGAPATLASILSKSNPVTRETDGGGVS